MRYCLWQKQEGVWQSYRIGNSINRQGEKIRCWIRKIGAGRINMGNGC